MRRQIVAFSRIDYLPSEDRINYLPFDPVKRGCFPIELLNYLAFWTFQSSLPVDPSFLAANVSSMGIESWESVCDEFIDFPDSLAYYFPVLGRPLTLILR